jgi:hypothetical protein
MIFAGEGVNPLPPPSMLCKIFKGLELGGDLW